jgi:peptidyl-prolyl cis-trans isomerase C/foldase protein PrsA
MQLIRFVNSKYMWMKLVAFAVLLWSGLPAGCRWSQVERSGASSAIEDNSPVIVEINGSQERLAAFERFVKARLSDFYSQVAQGQADSDQLRSRLFDEFVKRQLIVREAQRRGIYATDEEILRAVENQHQQTSAEGADQSQATLASLERVQEIENDLITIKYYKSEVLKDVRVTPEEIESFYKENEARYRKQNGFYVREIRVPTAEQAQQLHRQLLKKPDDFAILAREYSKAPTAINGGLIYYETQQLPPALEEAITPLKVGAISGVVKSNYGFHIFKLEKRAEVLPPEKVRQQIEEDLLKRKNQALIDAFNERALAAAQIKIYRDRLGFNYVGNLKQVRSDS